ncbi:MAG TPA: EAL domain-containing protein [Thermotogota bacterium]|nr:EAL domain-containing protein [Thermotogota bacterium]
MNKKIFQIFILIAVPIIILWCWIVVNNLRMDKQYTVERIIGESQIYDANTSVLIAKQMNEIYENMNVIRDSNEMSDFINDETDYTKSEFLSLLLRIMRNKEAFDQVRYLDAEGNEIIRIDYEGVPVVCSSERLNNQEEATFFLKTADLEFGEYFISRMTLNSENGVIERPYKPILLFSTPVYDRHGAFKGVLAINYNADYFLSIMSVLHEREMLQRQKFYILNKNGGFIVHPDEGKYFSFMFDDMKEISMLSENPAIWEIVSQKSHGFIEQKNSLITFYDVLDTTKESNAHLDEKWILIHEIDISQMLSVSHVMETIFLTKNVIVVIVILVFAYIIALIAEKLRRKDYQLELTRNIAESTNDAVLITDDDTTITYVNHAYEEATGYAASEVIGATPGEFKSGKHDKEFYEKMWQKIEKNGYWEGMLWDRKKNGLIYPKQLRIISIKDKTETRVLNYIGIFSDLSETHKKQNFFENLDYSDGEFRLPNEEMMIELLTQSIKKDNFKFMVLSIMIENYNQLQTTFRDTDFNNSRIFINLIKPLLGENDFVAQTGRNLFAVIVDLENINGSTDEFVFKLHKELTKVMTVNGRNLFFKIKIGVSYWPKDADDLKKLILNSIVALEWTTSHHEAEIAFFSQEMITKLNRENEIEGHLRTAIENNELFVVYQPQINIRTNRIIGMEALLRWESKALGFVPPDKFIPIAEKSSLIINIGNWVIRKVCEDIEYLNKNFIGLNETIRCAINLSTVQMEESGFLDKLFNTIAQYDVENSQLEMEITESMLLANEMKNIKNIEKIRDRGIKIAIDDFGTGYSSMSYLNTLPIDKIKVDRVFIKNYPENDDGKLAGILVNMAKSLDIEVLMEGVEIIEQVEFLKKLGCHYIQGYYYSKPLVFKEFIDFLRENNRAFSEMNQTYME